MEKYKSLDKIGDGTYGTVLKSVNKDISKYKRIKEYIKD